MPEYEFEASDGSRIVETLPMAQAPRFGAEIVRGGKTYARVPSIPGAVKVAPNIGFSSVSLPLEWRYAPRHNEQGEAVFHSQREVRESLARANDHGEKLIYE